MSEPQAEPIAPQGPPTRRPRDPWVRFACPRCGKRNKVDAMAIGRRAACARCGEAVKVTSVDPRAIATPAMRLVDTPASVEPPVVESGLRQLSAHLADRDAPASPRRSFRLPTWVMVVLHASLTLGTIAAIWLLHAHGYLPGFDAAFN